MGYMVRLGLWGAGTFFLDFRDFLGALEKGGVGALELVAMDMKARGMYVCRTLSYKGAEFDVVEAPLEAEMMLVSQKHRRTICCSSDVAAGRLESWPAEGMREEISRRYKS